MDANTQIDDLMVITGRLADLLGKENQALRNRKPETVAALLDGKLTLCRAYEARIQALTGKPEELAGVDPGLREKLHGLGLKLDTLMEENACLLKVGVEAGRRVVATVAEAVKSSHPGASTYSANGLLGATPGSAPRNVAISVDQSL
jgi:hypothetical protein